MRLVHRNIEDRYVNAIVHELDMLEEKGLSVDGDTLSDQVHEMHHLILPGEIKCLHVESSLIVNHVGAVMALMTVTTDGEDAELTLITDLLYNELSNQGKRFILAHEAGHIVNGHIKCADGKKAVAATASELNGLIPRTRSIRKEYEADQYAVKVLGRDNVIDAMTELHHLMSANRWAGFDFDELKKRQRRIKNGAA